LTEPSAPAIFASTSPFAETLKSKNKSGKNIKIKRPNKKRRLMKNISLLTFFKYIILKYLRAIKISPANQLPILKIALTNL
jgi:hypothetical protein